MAHVRKMALVGPRLFEMLRTAKQSPSELTLCYLDAEMTGIDVSEKVRLCN